MYNEIYRHCPLEELRRFQWRELSPQRRLQLRCCPTIIATRRRQLQGHDKVDHCDFRCQMILCFLERRLRCPSGNCSLEDL